MSKLILEYQYDASFFNPKDALGGTAVSPSDRDKFRQAFFKQAEDPALLPLFKRLLRLGSGTQFSDADLKKLAKDIWGTDNLDIFDRFHIAPRKRRAANDNAWRTATFRFVRGEAA